MANGSPSDIPPSSQNHARLSKERPGYGDRESGDMSCLSHDDAVRKGHGG